MEVPDRDPFSQEGFCHPQDISQGEEGRDQLVHHLWMGLGNGVQQSLELLAADELVAVLADDFRDMGGYDRGVVHHRIAEELGPVPYILLDPDGGEPESRLGGLDTRDLSLCRAGIHGQKVAPHELAPCDLDPFEQDRVFVRLELEVVADVDRRNDEAHIRGELPPDGLDTTKQLAVLLGVDQRYETIAYLEFQDIDGQQGLDALILRGRFFGAPFLLLVQGGARLVPKRDEGDDAGDGGQEEEREAREPRHQPEEDEHG